MIFNRLYNNGSSFQSGTLLQLRSLLNRRNVKRDISGKFNEAIDFFELVVTAYIIAASLHYFGMKSTPTRNGPSAHPDKQSVLLATSLKIVDEYVVVHEMSRDKQSTGASKSKIEPSTPEAAQLMLHQRKRGNCRVSSSMAKSANFHKEGGTGWSI